MYVLNPSIIRSLVENALAQENIIFSKLEIDVSKNIITSITKIEIQVIVDELKISDTIELSDAEMLKNQYSITLDVSNRLVATITRGLNEQKLSANAEQGWAYEKNYCKIELHMNGQIIDAFFRPQPDLTAYEYAACRAAIAGAIVGSKLKYLIDHDALRHWKLIERLDKKGNKIYTIAD